MGAIRGGVVGLPRGDQDTPNRIGLGARNAMIFHSPPLTPTNQRQDFVNTGDEHRPKGYGSICRGQIGASVSTEYGRNRADTLALICPLRIFALNNRKLCPCRVYSAEGCPHPAFLARKAAASKDRLGRGGERFSWKHVSIARCTWKSWAARDVFTIQKVAIYLAKVSDLKRESERSVVFRRCGTGFRTPSRVELQAPSRVFKAHVRMDG